VLSRISIHFDDDIALGRSLVPDRDGRRHRGGAAAPGARVRKQKAAGIFTRAAARCAYFTMGDIERAEGL